MENKECKICKRKNVALNKKGLCLECGLFNEKKSERAFVIAEQVKLLFGFAAQLIPDLDILKDTMQKADNTVSTVNAMAPVIMAFGEDWEEKDFEARLRSKRATALYDLIKVLDDTEKERLEFKKEQVEKAEGRDNLRNILGI